MTFAIIYISSSAGNVTSSVQFPRRAFLKPTKRCETTANATVCVFITSIKRHLAVQCEQKAVHFTPGRQSNV